MFLLALICFIQRIKRSLLKESDISLLLMETDGPVYYKRCFENVITSPVFIISLINSASIILKKNFNELADIIFKNSFNFLNAQVTVCIYIIK